MESLAGDLIKAIDERLRSVANANALKQELRSLQRVWHPDKNGTHGPHVTSLCNRVFNHVQDWAKKVGRAGGCCLDPSKAFLLSSRKIAVPI